MLCVECSTVVLYSLHSFFKELEPSVDSLLNWIVSIEKMLRSKETVNMDADSSEDEINFAQVTRTTIHLLYHWNKVVLVL